MTTDSAKRALLERLIDDAGLFPPANRPMRDALRHHARHGESAYRWLGGAFVLPVSRVDEFLAHRDAAEPVALSVILDAGAQGAKGDLIRADLHRAERLAVANVTVRSYEARLPRTTLDATEAGRLVRTVAEFVPAANTAFYYEDGYRGGWRTPLENFFGALAGARAASPAHITLAAKVRCGGADTASVPTADDLAAFIATAQTHGVPWKATAGLHRPFSGLHGYGFINLFVAGIAHHAGVLGAERIADVLRDADPLAFTVGANHLQWRDVRVESAHVAAGRTQCTGFGSCSFDEPVNALREAGILS